MGVFGQQGGVSSRYVRYLASYAVPEDHICPCLPDTKLARGFIPARLHDSIEMNAKYQVIVSSYGVLSLFPLTRLLCTRTDVRTQDLLFGGLFNRAARYRQVRGQGTWASLHGGRSNPREIGRGFE